MLMIAVSALLAGNSLIAWMSGEYTALTVFATTALTTFGIAATVLILTDRSKRRTGANDGLAVAVLFWTIVPLPASIPFMIIPGDGTNALTAYFEAVSSLTTTGASLLADAETPFTNSLLFWRAQLHILGAIASVTIAATVLSALNLGGPGIHRSYLFTIRENDFFGSMPKVIRTSSVLIVAAILVLGSILLITGATPRHAASWAVSAISTGLVDPTSAQYNPDMTTLQAILIFIGLVLGTIGFLAADAILSGKLKRLFQDPEALALSIALFLITILVIFAGVPVFQSLGWSLSSVSTSGIALSDSLRFERIPLPLVLIPTLIGGSALSAAGGIKLGRMVVLIRRVGLEFVQLGYRGSIQKFKFRGRFQSERTVMGVWVYLVGYVIASVMGVLIFSILGLSFDGAIETAIGSLTNSGHLIQSNLLNNRASLQICALLGMILGRLEVIALLPALNPRFWQS